MESAGMRAISTLPKLTHLKLKRGKLLKDSDFVAAFSDKKLKNLVELDISECAGIGDEARDP